MLVEAVADTATEAVLVVQVAVAQAVTTLVRLPQRTLAVEAVVVGHTLLVLGVLGGQVFLSYVT
jgi:hypothetical protein